MYSTAHAAVLGVSFGIWLTQAHFLRQIHWLKTFGSFLNELNDECQSVVGGCHGRHSEPPHYEEVIQQDIARAAAAGIDNNAYECGPSDVRITLPPPVPPRISNMIAVDYPNDPGLGDDVGDLEKTVFTEKEAQMLIVIREVVRRCTHVNPHKRPTAAEMLKLLKTIRVPELEKNQDGAAANNYVQNGPQ